MSLYLLRHTNVNIPAGICYGQTDIGLASTYEHERDVILKNLSEKIFDEVHSSPLSRCTQLANDVANGKSVITDARLLELNFGNWEGIPWNTIENSPESKAWFADYVSVACPNGESYQDLIKRVTDFHTEIYDANKNTLIVTHSGVIRAFMTILKGIEPKKTFEIKVDFGSLTEFEI